MFRLGLGLWLGLGLGGRGRGKLSPTFINKFVRVGVKLEGFTDKYLTLTLTLTLILTLMFSFRRTAERIDF
jgi:hypothetical protein